MVFTTNISENNGYSYSCIFILDSIVITIQVPNNKHACCHSYYIACYHFLLIKREARTLDNCVVLEFHCIVT